MGAPLARLQRSHQGQGDQIGHVKPSQAHQPQHTQGLSAQIPQFPRPLSGQGAQDQECGRKGRPIAGQGGDHKAHAAVCQPGGRHPLHQSQDGILYRHLEDHQCCQGPAHPGKSPPCLPGLLIPLEKRPYLLHMLPPPDSLRLERVGAPTAVQALFIEWPWNPLPRGAWR